MFPRSEENICVGGERLWSRQETHDRAASLASLSSSRGVRGGPGEISPKETLLLPKLPRVRLKEDRFVVQRRCCETAALYAERQQRTDCVSLLQLIYKRES